MMSQRQEPPQGRRRLGGIVLATLLALALGASPAAMRPALAIFPLVTSAETTYTLDPDAGRVHVAIKVRATNLKPDSGSTFFFYTDVTFPIQPEAQAIRAADASGALSITTDRHRLYTEAQVHLRRNLLYRQSTTFTLRYDLVGGAPRSESPVRVGRAFATFGVWAWGDDGLGTVEVRTPKGFGTEAQGSPMELEATAAGQTLRASPDNPAGFYAIVSSENRTAYGSTRVSLGGGVEVVVHAWPEDDVWDETVSETLRVALPELLERIGLAWPIEHDLSVRERFTPALEGYAGLFFTDEQRIDISEDLDPFIIVHEASHTWFHQGLFADRWIYEGLADEFAWQVLTAVGEDPGDPERPGLTAPGHIVLSTWAFPEVIRDQETNDREQYGYQAASWVMHGIAREAGVDGLRAAFAAADANRTAYPGAGTPEVVAGADSWRRFLDLIEPPDEPDSPSIDALLRTFVLQGSGLHALEERGEARTAYRELIQAGEGWLPPWYVRQPMGDWRFDLARTRMDEALGMLRLRDQVADAAAALDLQPDDALRTAYEGTSEAFDGATGIGQDQLDALAALADARGKVEAEPDLVSQIGLVGETPRVPYEEARAAFERGELDLAVASAAAAAAIVTGAAATGQQRLLIAVGGAVLLLLLLLLVGIAVRRRRRRHALPTWGPPEPIGAEPYATLAADPAAAPPPTSEGPPDPEGGHADGDTPVDR
jgi:hypothetical protein